MLKLGAANCFGATVIVKVMVAPETYQLVLLGVKVPVIVEVPAPTIEVLAGGTPLTLIVGVATTDVLLEENDQSPRILVVPSFAVGSVHDAVVSVPKVLFISAYPANVGVFLSTVICIEVVTVLNFVSSVGVQIAYIVEVPPDNTEAIDPIDPLREITLGALDSNLHAP